MKILRFTIEKIGVVPLETVECIVCHANAAQLTHADMDADTGNLIRTIVTCECGAVTSMETLEEGETE